MAATKSSSILLALALLAIIATSHLCLATPLASSEEGSLAVEGSASRHLTMDKWWCQYQGKRYDSWKGYSKTYQYYYHSPIGQYCCYDAKAKKGYWKKSSC